MSEEFKTEQEKNRFRYFYHDENSKGKYLAPIVYALRKGEKISKEQLKIFLEDFKDFEIPLLPAKTVKRPEGSVELRYYFKMAHLPTRLGESKHNPDPFKNVVNSAFEVVYFHLQGKNRNGENDVSGEIYDKVFDKYKEKIDIEAWKKGILKDSEKEAADALEKEIENLIVGALAEEIVEILVPSAAEKELMYVSNQKNGDGEEIEDEWGSIESQLENRIDNPQERYLEEKEYECLCQQFYDYITEKIIDFIEIKDGRGGKIKRFYKRDERYRNHENKVQQSKKDNDWVEDVCKNLRLREEGDYAINFVLYFTWKKNNARIKADKNNARMYSLEEYIDYVKSKGGPEQNISTENDHYNNIFLKSVEFFLEKWLAGFQDADDDEKELLKNLVENALHKMKVKYSMENLKRVLQEADNDQCELILKAIINNSLARMDAEKRKELEVKEVSIDALRLIAELFMEKAPVKKKEEKAELESEVKLFLKKLLEEIQNAEHDQCEAIIKKLMPEIERADSDKQESILKLFLGESDSDTVSVEHGLHEINNDMEILNSKSNVRKEHYKELKGRYNATLTFFYYALVKQFSERQPDKVVLQKNGKF